MLIIFDFDGVLRSTSWEGLYKTYIAIAKWLNKDWREFFKDIEEFKKWWNPDWHKNYRKVGIKNYKNYEHKMEILFHSLYNPYLFIFPWVTGVLKKLSGKHKLAILSAASENSIRNSLKARVKYFNPIISYEQVKKLKPDPEGINLILEKTKADPAKSLMIGDTEVDVLAGKRAGIKTGVVSWGLGEWEELLKLNPDYLFEKPEDFLTKIKPRLN